MNTSVGYLPAETENDKLLKDTELMRRLQDIHEFNEQEKQQFYFNLDAVIREIKNRRIYSAS